jgi:hypothetical protein
VQSIVFKIIGMFAALEPRDLNCLAPDTRRRFAQICKHWAEIAEPQRTSLPKSGILAEINNGAPRHE